MKNRVPIIYYTCAFLLLMTFTAHAALKTNTWNGGSGTWNTASNWSLNVVPNNNNGSNDQYVADIDQGKPSASAVVIDQSLAPTINAVVLDANDSLMITNGAALTLTNSATINGKVTLAAANSFGAILQFNGTTMLGGTGQVVYGGIQPMNDLVYDPSGTLTIGSTMTLHGGGGVLEGSPSAPVLNQGKIYTDASNLTMSLYYVVNQGQVLASNNSSLYLYSFTNANSSTVTANGATLTFDGPWSNSGVISGNLSFIELNGVFNTPGGSFINNSSTININGMMLNTSHTLALTAATGPWYLNGGTIQGGTFTASGDAELLINSGILDGLTLNGPLTLPNGARLNVTTNGLTLNSTMTLAGDAFGSILQFNGTATLGGTGQVVYSALHPINDLVQVTSGTLTIGPGITFHGAGGALQGSASGPVINQGTIYTDASNLTMNLQYVVNEGQVLASNGSSLYLFSFTNADDGTVTVSGGTLTLDGSWSDSGVISGNLSFIELNGVFNTPGGNFVNVGSTININGTMINSDRTLALTPPPAPGT